VATRSRTVEEAFEETETPAARPKRRKPEDEIAEFPVVNIDKLRDQYMKCDSKCWGCVYHFGPSRFPGEDPLMDRLVEEYYSNRETMLPSNLVLLIRDCWEDIYWRECKTTPEENTPQYWSVEQIHIHLRRHLMDDVYIARCEMQDYDFLQQTIYQGLLKARPTDGVIVTDPRQLCAYTKFSELKQKAMQTVRENRLQQ
jgi:hypothetical protein